MITDEERLRRARLLAIALVDAIARLEAMVEHIEAGELHDAFTRAIATMKAAMLKPPSPGH